MIFLPFMQIKACVHEVTMPGFMLLLCDKDTCVWSNEKPLAPLATNEEGREALIPIFFLASTLTKQAYQCCAIKTPVEQCA